MKYHLGSEDQLTLPGLADQEESNQAVPSLKRKAPAKPASELAAIPYLVLDLSCGLSGGGAVPQYRPRAS